jgi:hypothetical protein
VLFPLTGRNPRGAMSGRGVDEDKIPIRRRHLAQLHPPEIKKEDNPHGMHLFQV